MTNNNLLQAMGRIDPRLIADAAPDIPQKKSVNKTWVKWASLAACFVLIIGTIIGAHMPFTDDNTFNLPTDINNIIWDTNIGDIPSIETEVPLWEGWRVDYTLYQKLKEAEAGQYFALHISKIAWENFVYEGKTVVEIRKDMDEKYALIEKLGQFLKDGHLLKYGDLLYTEGTPEGEKWAKTLYDERIEYYGKDFLANYIVDGEFDQATAEFDYSNSVSEAEQLEIIYDDFYKAYHSSYVEKAEKIFSDVGICTVVKNNKLFIFIRKEELARLRIPDRENYKLSLAKRRNYEHEEDDIPTLENNVTGFALAKIECETFDNSPRFSNSDNELIEKINALIKAGQFDTDRIVFSITSSEALSVDLFSDINYESINVTRKYKTSAFAWMYVKYENIDLEALKNISNMKTIKSIHIYLESKEPDLPG